MTNAKDISYTDAIKLIEQYISKEIQSRCVSPVYAKAFEVGMLEAILAEVVMGTLNRESIIKRLTKE